MISILAIACHEQEGSSLGDIDFGVLTPDQKTEKTLTLQFNAEAQNDPNAFVQFVFLTKAGDEFPKDQIYFLVNGKKHLLKFYAKDYTGGPKDVCIGIEFSERAKEQVYEGRFVIAAASPDLLQNISYGTKKEKVIVGDRTSGLKTRFEYRIPFPMWLKGSIYGIIGCLILLGLWFGFLKRNMYQAFDGGVIELMEPEQREIKFKGLRMLYLGGNIKESQSNVSKIFTGAISHQLKEYPIGVTIYPVKIKNKVWHKIKNDTSTTMEPIENTLYDFAEYKLTGSNNQTIKLIYKNSKHQPLL